MLEVIWWSSPRNKIHSLRNEGLSDSLSSEHGQNGIPFRAPCGVGMGGRDVQGEATKQTPFISKKKKDS